MTVRAQISTFFFSLITILIVANCLPLQQVYQDGMYKQTSYDSFEISQHLATLSPYFVNESAIDSKAPDGCNPVPIHFNFLARHGAREPTNSDVKKFTSLQETLQTYSSCIRNPDYAWLKNWVNPYTPLTAGELDYIGEQEHYELSKRLVERYFPLLSSKYHPIIYPMQSTQIFRTSRSANSFGYSMLESLGELGPNKYEPFSVTSESDNEDIELRFFDNCPNYIHEVIDNDTTIFDGEKYFEVYSKPIISKIQNLLQFPSDCTWDLSSNDIDDLISACAFDIAVTNDTSYFCTMFDESDILVYEYKEDLESYYQKGYGIPLSYEISCPLLVDFFDEIDRVINASSSQQAKLRFAHAETVMPFVSLLGLFKDPEPLHWNSPSNDIQDRLWRSSQISSFAANVAFLLYQCSDPQIPYRVKLLHNEQEYEFPGCGELFCPYSTLKEIYSEPLSCNFDQMCGTN